MKKILLIGLVTMLMLIGCSDKGEKMPALNGQMSNEERYTLYSEESIIKLSDDKIKLSYITEFINFEVTATINLFDEYKDPFVMITYSYSDENNNTSGTIYRMREEHLFYMDNADYTDDLMLDSINNFNKKLNKYYGLTLDSLKEFFLFINENHGISEENRAKLLAKQRLVVEEKYKVTKAVCSYEDGGFLEEIIMLAKDDYSIDQAIWQDNFDLNKLDEQSVWDFIEEEKEVYSNMVGVTYEVIEEGDKIKTVMTISLSKVNQADLVKVGILTEEGLTTILLDDSIKVFEDDNYTCTRERK